MSKPNDLSLFDALKDSIIDVMLGKFWITKASQVLGQLGLCSLEKLIHSNVLLIVIVCSYGAMVFIILYYILLILIIVFYNYIFCQCDNVII